MNLGVTDDVQGQANDNMFDISTEATVEVLSPKMVALTFNITMNRHDSSL